jgi:hypothetical protein
MEERERVMMPKDDEMRPMEEPLAELERQLIGAYLAGAGENFQSLMARNDDAARKLLAEASLYASDRLCEIESRSHYLRKLHGSE